MFIPRFSNADNPCVDAASNGLNYVVEGLKNEQLVGYITLINGERSDLAERVTLLLQGERVM